MEDTLIYFGGAVKTRKTEDGETELYGPCAVFDNEESGGHDLEGEFFSAKSYFGPAVKDGAVAEFEATFNHGFASRKELLPLAEHEFSHAVKVEKTDTAVMASLILDERDAYEKMLAQLAEKGKLSWSSATAPHRVKRVKVDDGRVWLKRWPFVEIAVTHTPAEPRTFALPLKSLFVDEPDEQPATKAQSLDRRVSAVYRAFHSASKMDDRWVAEVFDEYAIVHAGESYWRAKYSYDSEKNAVDFSSSDEWVAVVEKREWVESRKSYEDFVRTLNPDHKTIKETAMSEVKEAATKAVEVKEEKDGSTAVTPDQIQVIVTKSLEDARKAWIEDMKPSAPTGVNGAPAIIETLGDNYAKGLVRWIRTGDVGGVKHLIDENDAGQQMVTIGADPGTNEVSAAFKAWKASNDTDMNIGTAADGGNAVPTGHLNEIIRRRDEMMVAQRLGVRLIPGVGTTVNVPIDDEDDGEFVETAEAVDSDRDAPAIGQKAFTLKVYTKYLDLSYELLRDETSGVLSYISDFVGRGMAKTHNSLLVTEVTTNGTLFKTFPAEDTFTIGDLEDIEGDDDLGAYLDDASVAWLMRNSTFAKMKVVKGDARWYAEPASGGASIQERRELLGYPVYRSNKVAAVDQSGKSVLFGNWFYVGYRSPDGMQFLRDPYSKAIARQVRLHYYFSTVYGVLQAEAIGYGQHINT